MASFPCRGTVGGALLMSHMQKIFKKPAKMILGKKIVLKRCKMIIYIIKTHKNMILDIAARAARRKKIWGTKLGGTFEG